MIQTASSPVIDTFSGTLRLHAVALSEKETITEPSLDVNSVVNPVLRTAEVALRKTALVELDPDGLKAAALYIHKKMREESYTPRTWRTHPLHLLPPEIYSPADPGARATLDWIFMISALNFSFWSEYEGTDAEFGVEWYEGWGEHMRRKIVHTGYWSLVAAIDKALDSGVPFTDPAFYSSEEACPDSFIEKAFEQTPQSKEPMSLLKERISIMREVGTILCVHFGGSFLGFVEAFRARYQNRCTALQFVQMVTDTFPSFRDETRYEGERLFFWKRAQILTAETWAAFYPANPHSTPHPFFPSGVQQLTMFADYRVPQILHHLRILHYPTSLLSSLRAHAYFSPGSREEVSIRAGSICAVEELRKEIVAIRASESALGRVRNDDDNAGAGSVTEVSSVLLDFYLWDLAKKVECGEFHIEGIETRELIPAHRTRSIWY